ncbi:hypothetical protein L1887_28983 [Cichorium endivia]|nr:hypothetical protein L1887_28983 [Cichorium endivia]
MCTFPISDNSLLRRDLNENFPAFSFDCFFVDCFCTIRIVDETNPSSGISVNVFGKTFEDLPHVESTGDIIQFSQVLVFPSVTLLSIKADSISLLPFHFFCLLLSQIKTHGSEVNAVFYKKVSSFALYEGKDSSNFVPYQVSSQFHGKEQDKKLIADLRKWTVNQQPETALNGSQQLKDIKKGIRSNLICKVLHVCEVTQGEWMLYIWDGTDTPPINIHSKLEEELKKPIPLQLEETPLSRDVLCTFPTVGTILRMTTDKYNDRLPLHLPKVGTWVHFINIEFQTSDGLWLGIFLRSSNFNYLSDDNKLVLNYQSQHQKRYKGKWTRMPLSSLPWPSHVTVTDTEHQHVPSVTLMDIITHQEVTMNFRCVVRVVATFPTEATNFRGPDGYILRLTLEDPTARIHAYLYEEDAHFCTVDFSLFAVSSDHGGVSEDIGFIGFTSNKLKKKPKCFFFSVLPFLHMPSINTV